MDIFDRLEEDWPSPIVARSEVERFSGGILNPKTLSNRDCLGEGPKGRFRIGRKVGYSVRDLVEWMRDQVEDNILDEAWEDANAQD